MNKLLFTLLFFAFVEFAFSQNQEKTIANQSLLIDALREDQIGHTDKAIEILEKLKYEPEFRAVSNFYLAKLYRSTGNIGQAFASIDQSILAEPDNSWYLILKANMTEENGQNLETAETFEKLSILQPDNFGHFDNAAYFYLKAEEYKKALDILNKAQRTFGIMPPLAIKKSYVLGFLKKNKNAIEALEECHDQYPANKELIIELIKLHSEMKNQAQVEKYLEKLEKIDPQHAALFKLGKETESEKNVSVNDIIESPEASLDDKIKVLFVKLKMFSEAGDKSGIQSLLAPAENLRKQFPLDPKTIALIGDIHFQLNDLLQAKDAYMLAIRDGQVPYSVWDNLLFCLIHLNHWKTANNISQKCMDLYPSQSFPNYVFILSNFKLKQFDGIISSIDQLELMVSHNEHKKTEVLILKAKIQSDLKNETESAKTWKLALDTDRDFLATLEYCVFMASKGSTFPKEYFDKSMNSEYIHESFKLDKAAELFYYTREYNKAKQYIENSIAKGYCESTDALLLASKIYKALGNTLLANEFGSKAQMLLDNENNQQTQQHILVK